MNMSLHPIAEAVRSQGRNGDSMLVHMTPGEVAALQQMAEANGGSLSINPETGQPEAFFLAALLPALAGAAMPSIAAATGIAALANPITSSLLIGGLTGAITGDMKQGLMAGLGAYGGFGLGESLMGAAAPAVTTPVVSAAGAPAAGLAPGAVAPTAVAQNVAQAGQNVFAPGGVDIGLGALQKAGMPPTPAGISVPPLPNSSAVQGALQQLGLPQGANLAQPLTQAAPMTTPTVTPVAAQTASGIQNLRLAEAAQGIPYGSMSGADMMSAIRSGSGTVSGSDVFSQMGSGLQSVTGSGEAAMNFAKDNIGNIGMVAASAIPTDKKEEEAKKDTTQYQYLDFDPGQLSPEQIAAQYADRPGTTAERLYRQVSYGPRTTREVTAAGGGLMSMAGGDAPSYKRGGLKEDSFIVPADVLAALGNGSNNAGLAALNKMLAKVGAPRAEKIDGPGDGMSDSIPTSIEGKQPARVAKDEAYVPTEAVRRLGGGDVKKGAKKLYNLMARVRKAAHGDDKQQRRVNPDRLARA